MNPRVKLVEIFELKIVVGGSTLQMDSKSPRYTPNLNDDGIMS